MATKSILKDVVISDKKLASTFVEALSNPNNVKFHPTDLSRECKTLKGDSIKEFFKNK
ncbi:MAG: hypothetical protein MR487_06010 [Lachnospiraceae bacterium]|nr:hypothetical protein [Lachnospiraceae bacterium]